MFFLQNSNCFFKHRNFFNIRYFFIILVRCIGKLIYFNAYFLLISDTATLLSPAVVGLLFFYRAPRNDSYLEYMSIFCRDKIF